LATVPEHLETGIIFLRWLAWLVGAAWRAMPLGSDPKIPGRPSVGACMARSLRPARGGAMRQSLAKALARG